MAAVFPESMDKLNLDNSRGSLATIENYIRYMAERMEFSMRNTTRAASGASVSLAELGTVLENMANAISALTSETNMVKGQLTGLQGQMETLNAEVSGVKAQIKELSDRVEELNGRVEELEKE